jgi:hypothetical protein
MVLGATQRYKDKFFTVVFYSGMCITIIDTFIQTNYTNDAYIHTNDSIDMIQSCPPPAYSTRERSE